MWVSFGFNMMTSSVCNVGVVVSVPYVGELRIQFVYAYQYQQETQRFSTLCG